MLSYNIQNKFDKILERIKYKLDTKGLSKIEIYLKQIDEECEKVDGDKFVGDYNDRQNDRGESLATESRKRVIRCDAQLSFDFATNQAKHTAESLESIHNFSKDENVGIPEAIHSGIQAQKVAKYIGNFSTQLDY